MYSDKENSKAALLFNVLSTFKELTHGRCCDAETQTASETSHRESLVEYQCLCYTGNKTVSYRSKLAAQKKKVEAQMQEKMYTKMQRFKDIEITKMRMEERETFQKELDKMKKDMEKMYKLKEKGMMAREKNAMDQIQRQQEAEETNVCIQKQTLQNREKELSVKMETFEKSCRMREEMLKTSEELLNKRELAVKSLEEKYEQKLKRDLCRYQHELKEEFFKRTEKLTENEKRNKVETARIKEESAALDAKLEEHKRACLDLSKLQVDLHTAQQQASVLRQQKKLLKEKLNSMRERLGGMRDYSSLKKDKAELQEQLCLLKKQLEEAQKENCRLNAELENPSEEQVALQMEVQRLHDARKWDQEDFEDEKRALQKQLQREMEHCGQLRAELTKKEGKTYRKRVEELEVSPLQSQEGGLVQEEDCASSDSTGSELHMFAEAKARIEKLNKENEALFESMNNMMERSHV